jgi:DNA repair protein RecN (Recombination protein N)
MLKELRIENFAIIDELNIKFRDGLTTLTGETGAGKSIIIDAVEAILGSRADATMVRSGSERAIVEGVFRIKGNLLSEIRAVLKEEDLLDDEKYLILAREIRRSGRNIARVNGHSVSAALLRKLGEHLVDVHGQSEHLSLLHTRNHLTLLDNYSLTDENLSVKGDLKAYRKTYKCLSEVEELIKELTQMERDTARRVDILNYQIQEIKKANLRVGEDEELRGERTRLANAESLANLAQESLIILDEGTPEAPATSELLGQVVSALANLTRLDASQAHLHTSAQNAFVEISELVVELRRYLETIEYNPKRLNQVEERLELIDNMKRKYGDSIEEILAYAMQAENELDNITHAEERLEELEIERQELLTKLGKQGWHLSIKRHAASKKLAQGVENELRELNMSGARFKVSFQQKEDPSGVPVEDGRHLVYNAKGIEHIEFLIAPNPGEGFKPLVKIASGGETSRLMLALKNVLAKADHIPTLIFDEIDQGIGGRVGAVVGEKLWFLARDHQVICITHLPQLAAFGDQHYHVSKQISDGRTTTRVKSLKGEERITELAQMLGEVSKGTLRSAREMSQRVKERTKVAP